MIDGEGKVRTVQVPWARPGSSFTLQFEAVAMRLVGQIGSAYSPGMHLKMGGAIAGIGAYVLLLLIAYIATSLWDQF